MYSNDLIIKYLECIAKDHEDWISSVLASRGFLIEYKRGRMVLSDDSFTAGYVYSDPSDGNFLNRLLLENELGRVEHDEIILNKSNFTIDKWAQTFKVYSGMEAVMLGEWKTWEFFAQSEAVKPPAILLDPFVAYFTKVLSAIGLSTCGSCDGHAVKKAYLEFCGEYNSTWFDLIMKFFVRRHVELASLWTIHDNRSNLIIRPAKSDYLRMYRDIYAVADLLYRNRRYLLDLKRFVCNQIVASDREGIIESMKYKLSRELQFGQV